MRTIRPRKKEEGGGEKELGFLREER